MRILKTLSAAIAATTIALGTAGVANAAEVTHRSDDPGYNEPIKVKCSDGTFRWLGVGVSSAYPGKCPGGRATQVLPGPGEVIRCYDNYGTNYTWSSPSVTFGGDNFYLYCVNSTS